MRVAVSIEQDTIIFVREWNDDSTIEQINALEVDKHWHEVFTSVGVGYTYDRERDEFVPPGWTLVDGVWTSPPVEPSP